MNILHRLSSGPRVTMSPGRLIYACEMKQADIDKLNDQSFSDRVKESYDRRITALTGQIKSLEQKGREYDQIREELKNRRQKMIVEIINQVLLEKGIKTTNDRGKVVQATYQDLLDDKNAGVKLKATSTYEDYEKNTVADVDKAVDQYIQQKGLKVGKTQDALRTLPQATASRDLDAPNAETVALQEMLDKRRGVLDKSRTGRANLLTDRSTTYRTRTSLADNLTNPDSGAIDDYNDGLTGPHTNENNPIRERLKGYLYAHDIFYGTDNETGDKAMQAAFAKPSKLFSDKWFNRLDMSDLEEPMGLKSYFQNVQEFSKFDRAIGAMASLLQLTDQAISDPVLNKRYKEYLLGKFAELKDPSRKDNEEKQIEHLYTVKTMAEFLGCDPKWKLAMKKIQDQTDPTRSGDDAIDDYPDWSLVGVDENKENPTRYMLNGYLFSVYLFSGRNQTLVDAAYKRAHAMFENASGIGTIFDQEMLEREPNLLDPSKDGFGLKAFLPEAATYTKHEQVKGVIAGLLRQAGDSGNLAYRKYLSGKLKALESGQGEEEQMNILATIRSPQEAENELKNELHARLLEDVIEASRQHNQFALRKGLKDELDKDPEKLSIADLEKLAKDIKEQEMDALVTTHTHQALKDLQSKHSLLLTTNSNLKTPRYNSTELEPLRDRIKKNSDMFGKAMAITTVNKLPEAVKNGYLRDLTTAEKEYYQVVAELDRMLRDVQSQSTNTLPEPQKKVPKRSSGGGTGPEIVSQTVDEIKDNWSSARFVESMHTNYVGAMVVDTAINSVKPIFRDRNGNVDTEITNGTAVERTAKDSMVKGREVRGAVFIPVHYNGREVWVPEVQLYTKADYDYKPPQKVSYDINTPGANTVPYDVNTPGANTVSYNINTPPRRKKV